MSDIQCPCCGEMWRNDALDAERAAHEATRVELLESESARTSLRQQIEVAYIKLDTERGAHDATRAELERLRGFVNGALTEFAAQEYALGAFHDGAKQPSENILAMAQALVIERAKASRLREALEKLLSYHSCPVSAAAPGACGAAWAALADTAPDTLTERIAEVKR